MSLNTEIMELQQSPYGRRQGHLMESLEQRAIDLYKQVKLRPSRYMPSSGIAGSYGGFTEKAMAPHSSTLTWKIPGMEEPGRL